MAGVVALLWLLIVAHTALAYPNEMKSHAVLETPQLVKSIAHARAERAATQFSQDDVEAILKSHNDYRKKEGAANMEQMYWNDELANMAQKWSDACNLAHGQPANTSPFTSIGQNLYWTSGTVSDPTSPVTAWWKEIEDYTYNTNSCNAGKVCGHYTQVVWGSSKFVGCGITSCTADNGGNLNSGDYVVCNYGPPGNYNGQKPFVKGDACTQCGGGSGFCRDGLCDSCSGQADCECKATCQNCGTVDQSTCSCTCPAGFLGTQCQDECKDSHHYCGANPGWPTTWCDAEHSYVLEYCPKMCGTCSPGDGSNCN